MKHSDFLELQTGTEMKRPFSPSMNWFAALLTIVLGGISALQAEQTNSSPLQFLAPTNGAIYTTSDEIPIVLHAQTPGDAFLTASLFANHQYFATASYCCWLCPCAFPPPGQETTLQIPVVRTNSNVTRTWQGWTNVTAGRYQLTASSTGEVGTVVQAAPVSITIVDVRLRIVVGTDGTVILTIPQGSLVPGGYEAQWSSDLKKWNSLGSFEPGNVAAFYYDRPTATISPHRFYRSVYVPSLR